MSRCTLLAAVGLPTAPRRLGNAPRRDPDRRLRAVHERRGQFGRRGADGRAGGGGGQFTPHAGATSSSCTLVNFGLTPELEAAAFAASTELFALPEQHKLSELSRIAPQTNTGYSPFAFENLNRSRPPDLKEAFNVRAGSGHVTSFAGCPARFEPTALELWDVLVKAARRYALALALALGLERDYFERSLEKMDLCTLRFLHYPPCDGPTEEADGTRAAVRVGEHTDFGAFTFLLLGEGAVGLQVKKIAGAEVGGAAGGEAGGWLDVETPPRAEGGAVGAVVNTGALMARWTNDTWRATAHRVVVPTAAAAAAHRYSVACFIDPDADARVAVDARFVAPGEEARYEPTTGLAYLLMKLNLAQARVNEM